VATIEEEIMDDGAIDPMDETDEEISVIEPTTAEVTQIETDGELELNGNSMTESAEEMAARERLE